MAFNWRMQILFLLSMNAVMPSQGRVKRCYTCRSRGENGDCKDPFNHNATTVEGLKHVEAPLCISGWCAKTVDSGNGDFDTATERMCVQRPPIDGEERCSTTVIDERPVYMCFCLGDLCNGTPRTMVSWSAVVLSLLVCMYRLFA